MHATLSFDLIPFSLFWRLVLLLFFFFLFFFFFFFFFSSLCTFHTFLAFICGPFCLCHHKFRFQQTKTYCCFLLLLSVLYLLGLLLTDQHPQLKTELETHTKASYNTQVTKLVVTELLLLLLWSLLLLSWW